MVCSIPVLYTAAAPWLGIGIKRNLAILGSSWSSPRLLHAGGLGVLLELLLGVCDGGAPRGPQILQHEEFEGTTKRIQESQGFV